MKHFAGGWRLRRLNGVGAGCGDQGVQVSRGNLLSGAGILTI